MRSSNRKLQQQSLRCDLIKDYETFQNISPEFCKNGVTFLNTFSDKTEKTLTPFEEVELQAPDSVKGNLYRQQYSS